MTQFQRQNVMLDEETEGVLHELFKSKETKQRLLEHYQIIASNYATVISKSPYGKPPVEIFCTLVAETFIQNITTIMYGLKASILFNVTASEDKGLTYKEIAQNLTDLMVGYENELKKAEGIGMVKEIYADQVKMLKSAGLF